MKKRTHLSRVNSTKGINLLTDTPTNIIVKSLEIQLNELKRRGVRVWDFDNKSRTVEQIRMIGSKVYFLVEEKVDSER